MNEPTLKCPHCGNPVAFAAAVAGRVVACPHCAGQFQMPSTPPPSAPVQRAKPKSEPIPPHELGYQSEPLPSGGGSPGVERIVKAELGSYWAATALANGFAIIGVFAVLLIGGLVSITIVLPLFKEVEGQPRHVGAAVVAMLLLFVLAFMSFIGLFLLRAVVLVLVDAARTLRAVERDTFAQRK